MKLYGLCETCKKKRGTIRFPYLADNRVALAMRYYSCDDCFAAVWAGAQ